MKRKAHLLPGGPFVSQRAKSKWVILQGVVVLFLQQKHVNTPSSMKPVSCRAAPGCHTSRSGQSWRPCSATSARTAESVPQQARVHACACRTDATGPIVVLHRWGPDFTRRDTKKRREILSPRNQLIFFAVIPFTPPRFGLQGSSTTSPMAALTSQQVGRAGS